MDPWWYHFVRTEPLWLNCLLSSHLLRLFDWLFNFYMRSGGDRQSNQCHGDQITSEAKLLAGTFFIVFYEWWLSLLGSNMFPSHSLNHPHTHFFFWYLCRKHFLKGPEAANTHSLDINPVVHFFVCLFCQTRVIPNAERFSCRHQQAHWNSSGDLGSDKIFANLKPIAYFWKKK